MNHQIRQYVLRLQPYFPTLRLAGSYLAIIMVMSIGFSAVIYHTSAQEIGRQLPPDSLYSRIQETDHDIFNDFFQQRISRGQHELLARLLLINLFVLLAGMGVSYILARRTLEPIEATMEMQSRFAADASHELRTPLAAIQTENEVALRNPKLTLARSKQLLASNLEEVTRLQALSEGLLKLARHDNRDIDLVPVSFTNVVSDAINHLLKPAQTKQITIQDDVGNVSALADQAALTQALSVLLDNAIKYSPAKTTVKISGGVKNKQAYLTVTDQGPGISKADMPYIFERFYRADPSRTSQQVSGHGLGLALAKKLVEQMGGDISVASKPGRGATFTISLLKATA